MEENVLSYFAMQNKEYLANLCFNYFSMLGSNLGPHTCQGSTLPLCHTSRPKKNIFQFSEIISQEWRSLLFSKHIKHFGTFSLCRRYYLFLKYPYCNHSNSVFGSKPESHSLYLLLTHIPLHHMEQLLPCLHSHDTLYLL